MAGLLKLSRLIAGAFVLLSGQLSVAADVLHDPTRPPAAFLSPASQTAASAPAEKPLVLQSVLLSPERKHAVISGQNVKLGGSVRGYRLVWLGSGEARLQGPEGLLILKLFTAPATTGEAAAKPSQGEPK